MPILFAVTVAFWLWMILDFFQHDSLSESMFSMVVFFTPAGALLYFFGFYLPRARHESTAVSPHRRMKELIALGEENLPAGQLKELADIYHGRGAYKDALRCYEKAVRLLPEQYSALLDMADCLVALNRTQEAIEPLRTVAKHAPHYREKASLLLASCLGELGNWPQALNEIEVVGRTSQSQDVRYQYAECLVKNGRKDDAVAVLNGIVKLAPLSGKTGRPWAGKAKSLLKQLGS